MPELAAHQRAVVDVVGVDQGGERPGEAAPVDEDVLERALRLQVHHGAHPRRPVGQVRARR